MYIMRKGILVTLSKFASVRILVDWKGLVDQYTEGRKIADHIDTMIVEFAGMEFEVPYEHLHHSAIDVALKLQYAGFKKNIYEI